jgi:hypothetical protein
MTPAEHRYCWFTSNRCRAKQHVSTDCVALRKILPMDWLMRERLWVTAVTQKFTPKLAPRCLVDAAGSLFPTGDIDGRRQENAKT